MYVYIYIYMSSYCVRYICIAYAYVWTKRYVQEKGANKSMCQVSCISVELVLKTSTSSQSSKSSATFFPHRISRDDCIFTYI